MKKFFLLISALLLFSLTVSAETLDIKFIDKEKFISDINNAVMSESPETLVKAASPYLTKMQRANIPNCFGCSLYLIKITEESIPEIQLTAADLAERFSGDLPEIHHHYLARLSRFAPLEIGKSAGQFWNAAEKSADFAFSESVTFLFIGNFGKIFLIFFAVFILVMLLKYPELTAHRYKHLVGFSRFYAVTFLITMALSSWIIAKDYQNITFLLIPLAIFFGNIGSRKEKTVLHITMILFILSVGTSLLVEKNQNNPYSSDTAYGHLMSIYSPDLIPEENIDLSQPGAYMAKGFLFLYDHNFSRAAFNFKKELSSAEVSEIRIMLMNAAGISLVQNGNADEAIPYLKEAYETTGNIRIGYNLAKALNESGAKEEGSKLDSKLMGSSEYESLTYPYVYLPTISQTWKYLCFGNTHKISKNIFAFLLFILATFVFYLFVLLLKHCYLGSVKISRCLECGSVMCSKCNSGSGDVCAVCRLMKADSSLFKRGEREIYENRRESFFRRQSLFMNLLTFTMPGGGLIFIDKTFEGALCLFIPLLTTLSYFMNSMGLVVERADSTLIKVIIIFADLTIYLISVIRALLLVRRNS